MNRWAVLWLCTLLAACAPAPKVESGAEPKPETLFADARFAPASERISADDVFALSEPMRQFLASRISREAHLKGRQEGLIDALYTRGQLKLAYDAVMTRNAAQAFDARSGNCLSLVIMTAAFAKALELPVRYQSVFTEETWTRSGDLYFASSHINLSIGKRLSDSRSLLDRAEVLTIDFLPSSDVRGYRNIEIGESTVVAMYMNNRAAELLAQGRVDDAYWWARAAVLHAPRFLAAVNTLGVIYQRRGHAAPAERAFDYVLALEPANTSALANLASLLKAQGRADEAQLVAQRLATIEATPPFHYFDQGLAAMNRGEYAAAKDLFKKEIDRAADYHEFHFWIALAYMGLRDFDGARKHLRLAKDSSTTSGDHALYAAKLDRITAQQAQQ
jgi:tetratricopeptide (TPR) repeat protein